MLDIARTGLAALATGFTGFFRREFVRGAFGMRGTAALTCNRTLLVRIHRREAATSKESHTSFQVKNQRSRLPYGNRGLQGALPPPYWGVGVCQAEAERNKKTAEAAFLLPRRAPFSALATNGGHVLFIATDRQPAFASNGCHVLAVAADRFATFLAGRSGFVC